MEWHNKFFLHFCPINIKSDADRTTAYRLESLIYDVSVCSGEKFLSCTGYGVGTPGVTYLKNP